MSVYKPAGYKKIFHDSRRFIAKLWLSFQPALQIAITGSQGKTNTTNIISHVCEAVGKTVVTDLALDTTFNVPITALKVRPWIKYVVWELGIDHPGEMENHLAIAKPKIGIITGISPVHTDSEHMGSLEKLILEKRKLIEVLPSDGTAILNFDDENVAKMAPFTKAKILWYGSNEKKCDIYFLKNNVETIRRVVCTLEGTSAKFQTKNLTFELSTKLIGVHQVYNLMVGYLLMKIIKDSWTFHDYQKIIDKINPLRGRMNVEKGPFNTVLLNDSLRANPESTKAGLETLDLISYSKGKKIAIIGEMGELEKPEEEHIKTGKQICKMNFDYILCIGPLRKFTIDEAVNKGFPKEKIDYAADVFEAAEKLKIILKPNDLWYLKGSLLRNYKRIVQLLNGEDVCCRKEICPYEHCGYDTN